jgi:hypothetical protein
MCVTCDQFDPLTAFTGDTCLNALKLFGKILPKEAPTFTFMTSLEYATFDFSAVTYEWGSSFIPFLIISGVLLVIAVFLVILFR